VRLIVLHTAEGATTYQSLGSFFANPASQVSSHVGIDDTPNTIGEYLGRSLKAWTQASANPYSVSAELCAFAAWNSGQWNQHQQMLRNTAAWIAEEARAFGIPLMRLTPAQAQGGASGVCEHVDLGVAGGGHHDCGPAFPIDQLIAWAGGSVPPSGPPPVQPPGKAPPFQGTVLVNFTQGHGTRLWQQQMATRGWNITVDDQYGGVSEGICRQFQAEKNLVVDGKVGPQTWATTWEAPVT
jgi:hypothetical protein